MNTFIKGITGRKGHQQCQRHHFSSICREPITASLRKMQYLYLAGDVKPRTQKPYLFKTIYVLWDHDTYAHCRMKHTIEYQLCSFVLWQKIELNARVEGRRAAEKLLHDDHKRDSMCF